MNVSLQTGNGHPPNFVLSTSMTGQHELEAVKKIVLEQTTALKDAAQTTEMVKQIAKDTEETKKDVETRLAEATTERMEVNLKLNLDKSRRAEDQSVDVKKFSYVKPTEEEEKKPEPVEIQTLGAYDSDEDGILDASRFIEIISNNYI